MFYHFLFYPFVVTVGFVRANAYVCSRILDDFVMHIVVKGDVLEFVGLGRMKNCIVLCESLQEWFEFFATYKTRTQHENVMKKDQ